MGDSTAVPARKQAPFDERARWRWTPIGRTQNRKGARYQCPFCAVRPKIVASRVTLRQYAPRWLDERRNSRGEPLRPTTRRSYQQYLDAYLLPRWGDIPLPKIERADFRAWFATFALDHPTLRAGVRALARRDALGVGPESAFEIVEPGSAGESGEECAAVLVVLDLEAGALAPNVGHGGGHVRDEHGEAWIAEVGGEVVSVVSACDA